MNNTKALATEFVTFLNKAVSPYHAVDMCSALLRSAGFQEIKESDIWKLTPKEKYYLTKNKSTIIAFAVGGNFRPGNGVSMVVGHTDSPCLRVKPVSKITSADCLQLGVMCYGGGLWRTWFDRDLSIAGSVIVQNEKGDFSQKLLHIEKPIMSIPSLAIHLDRESNDKFVFNKEDHLKPILATQVAKTLKSDAKETGDSSCNPAEDHHTSFLQRIAKELNIPVGAVYNFDLCVIDTQPAVIGGLNDEFIYGARLDNLVSTFCSVRALVESCSVTDSLAEEPCIRLIACYDNEECGSQSAQGGESALTEWVLRRLQKSSTYNLPPESNQSVAVDDNCAFELGISKSFLISADQAHALHPNYKCKYEENHSPRFHKGIVVKINTNQRYATTAYTHAFLQKVADDAGVPLQKFVVRNDSACGTTLGPILSAKLGLKTVDVGAPQLAMHSVREMACTTGVYHAKTLFTNFFTKYAGLCRQFENAS